MKTLEKMKKMTCGVGNENDAPEGTLVTDAALRDWLKLMMYRER